MANPHILTWANPTTRVDGTAFDPATEIAGYEISLDNSAAIDIPFSPGVTSFDLSTLAAFEALKSGTHTLGMAVVDKGGLTSAFSTPATFSVIAQPSVPTSVAVA
jgi:hypothetical protein